MFKLEWEYRDGIKSEGDKIMTACTHSTVIEDARNSQPKRINTTSPILSQRHTAESRVDVYYMYMKYTMFIVMWRLVSPSGIAHIKFVQSDQ